MENAIILHNVTLSELESLISRAVKIQLEEFFDKKLPNEKEILLTRDEACQFLRICKTSLWKWMKNGKIKAYGIGNRVYYKKAELIESIKRIN